MGVPWNQWFSMEPKSTGCDARDADYETPIAARSRMKANR